MVTVFLRGGLGNQMFQYAAGLNLANKNRTNLILDTVHIMDRFPRSNFAYRTFDLDTVFSIKPSFTALSKAAIAMPIPGIWLGIDLLGMNVRQSLGGAKIIYEDERKAFDGAVLAAGNNSILYGRWENEKYFAESEGDVRNAFTFRSPLAGEAKDVAARITSVNSISLHIRRGDRAKFKNVEILMGSTNIGYYNKAMAMVSSHVKDAHFFVFSDDIEWCRENIKTEFPVTFLGNETGGPRAAFHLELMSLCKHNIIANSTFSWWGAWLNKNPNKIVIAPKQWFGVQQACKREVVPSPWEMI